MIKYNKNLDNVEEYILSDRCTISEDKNYLKLDWNEIVEQPNPNLNRDIISFLEKNKLQEYPDITAKQLKELLAKYVNLDEENIQIFNGSDSALKTIFSTFIDKNTKVLLFEPTYTQVIPFIQGMGGEIISSQIQNLFSSHEYNFNDIEKADIVYIVNPNNPTGFLLKKETIIELIKKYQNKLFIVDEAYYEFSNETIVDIVNEYDNLIVTRTFSKAFGLAGVRIGYLVTNKKILKLINKNYNSKDINIIAQISAISSLKNVNYINCYCEMIKKTRDFFIDELKKLNYKTIESKSNFVLIRTENSKFFTTFLKENKILVRDRNNLINLQNCVRISIGNKKQMLDILEIIKSMST